MEKISVGIVGAGGYGGCGATEILLRHPRAEIRALMDIQDIGRPMSELYPHLRGFCDLPIRDPEDPDVWGQVQVVFLATPDGVGQKVARRWLDRGVKVIDYSGDFRFNDPDAYRHYAERIGRSGEHASPELLHRAVYGLSELHRREIAKADLVGNPGCFAASCILGLAPAVQGGLVEPETLVCDAKTGVSGAGKRPNPMFHYPARYETANAYRITGHQHLYEIERELGLLAGREIRLTFTPHVIPLCRGILSTIYARLRPGKGLRDALGVYQDFYSAEPFVRVFGPEVPQATSLVRGSNFCNLSINVDDRTGRLIVVSLIDNLVKGQAGSAVQNMNIMFGLNETEGLAHPGAYP